MLRYYHGFSEAEMATALRCRPGTVKSRLHYALRHLREIVPAQNELMTDDEDGRTGAPVESDSQEGSVANPRLGTGDSER